MLVMVIMFLVIMRMILLVTMRLVIMRLMVVMGRIFVMSGIIRMVLGVVRMHFAGVAAVMRMRLAFIGLGGLGGILAGVLDHASLDAVTMAAAARVAVA